MTCRGLGVLAMEAIKFICTSAMSRQEEKLMQSSAENPFIHYQMPTELKQNIIKSKYYNFPKQNYLLL